MTTVTLEARPLDTNSRYWSVFCVESGQWNTAIASDQSYAEQRAQEWTSEPEFYEVCTERRQFETLPEGYNRWTTKKIVNRDEAEAVAREHGESQIIRYALCEDACYRRETITL